MVRKTTKVSVAETDLTSYSAEIQQHEDAALKTSMFFFAEELLPYLHIEGKVVSFAPTELVHLEVQKLYQDFNLVMEDGSWKHFEFQSRNEGLDGLKRFRSYEALTSYQHNVAVTTYVLYSGTIRNPMLEFTEGINTYHVVPIIMKNHDAEVLIRGIERKMERNDKITKEDLVPLTLCNLMGGVMPQEKRVWSALEILQKAKRTVDEDTITKIEAVVYVMADKFLEQADLMKIMEEINMTKLGQMLVERGIEQGVEQGIAQGVKLGIEEGMDSKLNELIKIKMQKGKSIEEIADALEEDVETIRARISKMEQEEKKLL